MEQQAMAPSGAAAAHYVGFWPRLVAVLIDTVILLILMVPLGLGGFGAAMLSPGGGVRGGGVLSFVVNWVVLPALVILFWRYRGATPGKMVVHAEIVDADTLGAPSTLQLIGRYFAYIPSTIVFGLGFLWVAWDARKQAWHDKLARTVVIRRG